MHLSGRFTSLNYLPTISLSSLNLPPYLPELQLDSAIQQVLLWTSLVPSQAWINTFIRTLSDADVIANGSYSCTNGSEDNRSHSDARTHGGTISSPHLTGTRHSSRFPPTPPPPNNYNKTQNHGLCTTVGYHFLSSPRKDPLTCSDSPTFFITCFLEETCYEERFCLKLPMDSLLQRDH